MRMAMGRWMVRSWMVRIEKEEVTLIRAFGLWSREKGRKGLKAKVVKKEVSRDGHGDIKSDAEIWIVRT